MFINGHAHIFNLQTVLTDEAIVIMVNRLRGVGFPDFVVDAVQDLLQKQLDHPEYLTEDELLVRFVEAMGRTAAFRNIAGLPLEIRVLGTGSGELGVRAMEALLDRISDWVARTDGPGKSPKDVFQTLRVALQPDIPRVAKKLLAHMGPDDALVALMMDITSEAEGERDRLNFRRQIRGTQEAVLAFPGRVLPFVAVNPRRPDHFDLLRQAVMEEGFLGVKLYPSLGYELDTDDMRRVLDFCREEDVPITIHTSAGGFNKDETTAQYCHPAHWEDLFEDGDTLRVCFAHCGGWGGLSGQVHDQVEWAEQIFAFMDRYPAVYADISYHVDQMLGAPAVEEAYLAALQALVDGPRGERIVFGTDSWLLRLNMDDALYWRYFRLALGEDRFRKVASDVPRAFLGLPRDGAEPRANIRRHLTFLEERSGEVGAPPASWVREGSSASFTVVRRASDWTLNNWAHRITFSYLRDQFERPVNDQDFPECGPVRLRQLQYFKRSARGPSKKVLEGKTLELMTMCGRYAVPEADHDTDSIAQTLKDALADPDRTVAQVGATVDALYLFSPEVHP